MLQDTDLLAIQEVRTKVEQAHAAWLRYREFSQDRMDAIVEHAGAAARAQARPLAEMAVAETGYGNVKDKTAKNLLCSDVLVRAMRGMKLVGYLREVPEQKIAEYGVPMGVVAAVLPTTNPTSTAIYKTLTALKSGNGIVLSPHPRARKCTCFTSELLARAAVEAGAPEGLIQCVNNPTLEATNALMQHKLTAVILSTGGSGIVRAAYSSGKPAFGVGPGNVPVLVDPSADLADAVAKIVEGKSFDYGTVCSSEQTVVAERGLRDRILSELRARKAHLCDAAQTEALAKLLIGPGFRINAECVGQAPGKIARMAGFNVPEDTSILVVEIHGVGKQHPLSAEKLSPVLSLLFVDGFDAAVQSCSSILQFGGLGHTCVIYAQDDTRIRHFAERMPAFRVLVNTPSPQGSTGITTGIFPSMTLGCGAIAGNITSDNVGPQHLVNIKRLAYVVRRAEEAFSVPLPDSQPVAAGPSTSVSAERQAIAAAVERYLSQRGISAAGAAPEKAAQPSVSASTVASLAQQVVDRFLAAKGVANPAPPAVPAPTCGCGITPAPLNEPNPPAPSPPTKPEELPIAEFVCEEDVRRALQEGRKIFIGPKTIVTPAAREAAAPKDVLVVAKR